jgi:hypothetical protein
MATYPRKGMQRILAGSDNPELRVTLQGQDGDAVDASGTLTCSITRADGTSVVTDRATTNTTGVGTYTCTLTTAEALTLDVLTATWRIAGVTRATTHHRVVGGFLFSVAELAQRAGMQEFDNATLRVERDRVTDLIEMNTGVSWCPTYDYDETEERSHRCRAVTRRPLRVLRSMSIDGVAQSLTAMKLYPASGIIDVGYSFCGLMAIGVEHGFDQPTADLKDAALTAAADRLLREYSSIGVRTRSMSNEMGVTQQFSYAGDGHPTGIDEVDAVINAHDHRDSAFA